MSWRPLMGAQVGDDQASPLWHFVYAIGSRVPRIGGCLSSLIRLFVRNDLGSGIAFLRDFFGAAAEDIAALAKGSPGQQGRGA